MSLMKCPNCGKQYSEHAEKCPQCGLTFQEAQDTLNQNTLGKNARRKVFKKIIIALGVILALALAIIMAPKISNSIKFIAKDGTIIASIASNTKGTLPKEYSWAYGSWSSKNYSFVGGKSDVDLIIGEDYIQFNLPFLHVCACLCDFIKNTDCYPIYCFPKIKYTIYYGTAESIFLYFDGPWGYENTLELKNNTKTVHYGDSAYDGYCSFEKNKTEISKSVLNEYKEMYKSSSIWGEWQGAESSRNNLKLIPNSAIDILTKNGTLISLGEVVQVIDGNRILKYYSDTEYNHKEEYIRKQ